MSKKKVVTSSMAIALAMSSATGSFAETSKTDVKEATPKAEVVSKVESDDVESSDKEKPNDDTSSEDKPTDKDDEKVENSGKEDTEDTEDTVVKPSENGKPTADGMIEYDEYFDNTNIAIKGGFYLNVKHLYGNTSAKFKDIVPTMTFELLDVNGKSLGTAVASESNYTKGAGYLLHFKNVPEFKKGDKFRLKLKSSDAIVKQINMLYTDNYTEEDANNDGEADFDVKDGTLTNDKDILFSVGIATSSQSKNDKWIDEVEGSKNAPYTVTMQTDSSKIGIKVVTEDKKPVTNKKFNIERTYDKSKFTATTDSKGVLWLDRTKVQPVLEIRSTDDKYEFDGWHGEAEVILPITHEDLKLDDFLSTTVVLKTKELIGDSNTNGGVSLGKITTSMKINGNTDISSDWTSVDIELKDSKTGTTIDCTIDKDTKELTNIPDGEYIVTVKSTAAKVDIDKKVTVKDGNASLSLKVSPNHVLEVIKRVEGKNAKYNFSVINASDKTYTGTKAMQFGVTPGDTFMVKDNDTGEVFNVTIDTKIGTTKLVLGEGVVLNADGVSPHTRDMSPLYVGMLGASLLVVGVMAYKMSDDKRKAVKTLMMLGVIAGSMMATTPEVFAGAGGGTGSGSGGSGSAGGWLNTTNGTSNAYTLNGETVKQVIQFGFVPTQYIMPNGNTYSGMNLTEDGTESDLASAYKFTSSALKYALYMPLNDATEKDLRASGVLDFDGKASKYYLIRGKNRLHGKIPTSGMTHEAHDVISYRTVEKPSVAKTRNNFALKIMASVLEPAETNTKGVYEYDYGTVLNKKIKTLTETEKDLFFNDYLLLLGTRGITEAELLKLREEYDKGKITFVAQTLLRVHKGSDKDNGMYISVHSLARALGTGQGVDNHTYSRERRYLLTKTGGYCTVGSKGCSKTLCKGVGHASYGTWRFTRDGYSKTIQAITEPKVEGVTPVGMNIFGGWGFFHWKDSKPVNTDARPKITVNTVIDLYSADGNKVGTKKLGTTISNTQFSTIIDNKNDYRSPITLAPGIIEHNGKKYKVVKEETNKSELKDVKDNKSLYSPTLDGKTTAKPSINIPLGGGNGSDVNGYLRDILDVHTPEDINTHLGAVKEESDGNKVNNEFITDDSNLAVVDKYKDQFDENGNKIFSDAEATIYLKAEEITTTVTQKYEVPQWRLSRYWDDVADKVANANYVLTNPGGDAGHATSTVSPNGYSQLKLEKVDVSQSPWLKTEPKWKSSLNYVNVPTDGGASLSTPVGGTLLATKTSKDIDNVNFANWKNAGYTTEINSADRGNTNYKYKNSVTKVATLKYSIKDPKTYTHNKGKYYHPAVHVGETVSYPCRCYTTPENMPQTYAPATYKVEMTYFRHHPSAKTTVKLPAEKGKYEAFSWETKQTPTLKLYPEIVMANSDLSGRNNVSIVAGDLHREVTPLSYHFLQLDAEVGSKVVGTSVATDMKAQSLIQNVVSSNSGVNVVQGGAQVIHKGSATNTSYTLKGSVKGIKSDKATLTAKTFAVDIGNTALKNAWNPGTTYSTDKVNENYLSQFGTKEGNNWKFTAKFQPGLKIGTNEYKGKAETQPITGIPQATKEYSLVVRSGKLTLVSGKKPTAVTEELKLALERMKLTGTNKTVLDVFEYNQGAKLTEAEVANLINALRGTDEIKVGNNWYHEDTTVLVIREYTTIFDLPSAYMYSDKIQMQIPSLDSPIDKTQFYNKGLAGHTTLEIGIDKSDVTLKYDSSLGKWSKDNKKEMQYVVPNVSILDTTK